jgi:hypothetical protein
MMARGMAGGAGCWRIVKGEALKSQS